MLHLSSAPPVPSTLRLLTIGLSFGLLHAAQAQEPRHVVQFTGMVTSGDSLVGVPQVAVYVPKSSRYTITNASGYFSLVVLAGDSVVIHSPHYTTHVLIPLAYPNQSYSALLQVPQETSLLAATPTSPPSLERDFLKVKLANEPNLAVQEDFNTGFMKMIFDKITKKK
jgi:hypothetical protein